MAKTKKRSTADVKYMRRELSKLLPQYIMIHDAIAGESAVKGFTSGLFDTIPAIYTTSSTFTVDANVMTRAKRYLPQPNAEDKSPQNIERYKAYITRAVYYNVIGRTQEGMKGQVFLRDPVVKLPTELQSLIVDADGAGVGLDQVAGHCVESVLAYGRIGILIDYPETNGSLTKADLAKGNIHPILKVYESWQIINWRTKMVGAKRVLTLVVIAEQIDQDDADGFEPSTVNQYRVLRIDSDTGDYTVEIWAITDTNKLAPTETVTPKDFSGNSFKEIPFHFVGSDDNDVIPNKPPLYDMAIVNIGHFRNSADYEESCYFTGQPTLVVTGLTQDWVENVLKDKFTVGSRANIPLPVGATAQLLQAQANSMPKEAMDAKEAQMIALGARLVKTQPKKSATAKIMDQASETSTLAVIADNCGDAILWALKFACRFVGADDSALVYELNDDFDLTNMTADDQNAVLLQWQSGAISYFEMRGALRRGGTVTQDDEEARTAIKKDIADGMIPDPKLQNKQAVQNAPKAASNAGGPQPGSPRQAPGTHSGA